MSNWEIKDAKKSGDDWWILVGPNTSGAGVLQLVCAVIIAFGLMHLFGVIGLSWFGIMFVPAFIVSVFFFWQSAVISLILLGIFIF